MILRVLVLLVLIILVPSCKRENLSVKELLTSKGWKISSFKWNDQDQIIDECEKDNCTYYSLNGTISISAGAIKCSEDEPDVINDSTMTWALSPDEKTLYRFYGTDLTLQYIININSGKLELTSVDGYNSQVKSYVPC